MRKTACPLVSAALLLSLVTPPAYAGWPHDPLVNVPLCTASGGQDQITAAADGEGGAVFTWQDQRADGGDVYVQRVSSGGVVRWAANGVPACTAAGTQYTPQIVSDGAGGAIVAWYDLRSTTYDVWAQRIDSTGAARWPTGGLRLCSAAGNQTGPTLVSDGAGGALLAWTDARSGIATDIYAQHVNASGALLWSATGLAVCTAAGAQNTPVAAPDSGGGMIVVWRDGRGTDIDLYAQRIDASGNLRFGANGAAVCTATSDQSDDVIVPDGWGGAIIAWEDSRNDGSADIYAQHLGAAGSTTWTTAGVPICVQPWDQDQIAMTSDGAGGALLAWRDWRQFSLAQVYAQHVTAEGLPDWYAVNGIELSSPASGAQFPSIAPDGTGGAFVTWQDSRAASLDLYGARLEGPGRTQRSPQGDPVCTAPGDQQHPAMAADLSGGAIVAWADLRSGTSDVYAQRVDAWLDLGDPAPVVTAVSDVPADQGGRVTVTWQPSWLDQSPPSDIYDYRIWRSVALEPAALGVRGGTRTFTTDPDRAAKYGTLFAGALAARGLAWELAGDLVAVGPPSLYQLAAATASDSVAGSNPATAFMVQARESTVPGNPTWFSAPAYGYSVDNLAPATPTGFSGVFAAGTMTLAWNANTEPDLAGYRLYRGTSPDFVPSPANLVIARSSTGYSDPAGTALDYKLTALDVHGNESAPASFVGGTTGVGGTASTVFAFAPPEPNPAAGVTTLRYSLSRPGPVRLAAFDLAGRLVRVLGDDHERAGQHSYEFRLSDGSGNTLPSGVYLVRLDAEGRSLTRRVAIVR